jgi:Uncharacterized protein conserved in bacteria
LGAAWCDVAGYDTTGDAPPVGKFHLTFKANHGEARARGPRGYHRRARSRRREGPPPVERWNPPFCGDLDMRIAADGTWFYMKTPIGRHALVKLFASILKREGDKYFLVTPVEEVRHKGRRRAVPGGRA